MALENCVDVNTILKSFTDNAFSDEEFDWLDDEEVYRQDIRQFNGREFMYPIFDAASVDEVGLAVRLANGDCLMFKLEQCVYDPDVDTMYWNYQYMATRDGLMYSESTLRVLLYCDNFKDSEYTIFSPSTESMQ